MSARAIVPQVMAILALSGCATPQSGNSDLARTNLLDGNGRVVGSALLSERDGALTLTVQVSHLTPGPHGIHLHTVGQCTAPVFASAGGHLNPAMRQHGTENPAGSHLGDLPNLQVAADGAGAAKISLSGKWTDLAPLILDADGTAVVVHAGPDDYRSDPAGNSGGRIACGVLAAI